MYQENGQDAYEVFDLREYKDAGEAFDAGKKFLYFRVADEAILIFKDKVQSVTEEISGPDDNYTEFIYQDINPTQEEINEYLEEVK